jgi:hypothetical protein
VETASKLPVTDQLTRHTGASKDFIHDAVHIAPGAACRQRNTFLSSEQLAIKLNDIAVLGAQATSLTQSKEIIPILFLYCKSTQRKVLITGMKGARLPRFFNPLTISTIIFPYPYSVVT